MMSKLSIPGLRTPRIGSWWVGLVLLLLVELLAVTMSFDTAVFLRQDGIWFAPLLGESSRVGHLVVACAAVFLLLGGRGVVEHVREALAHRDNVSIWIRRGGLLAAQVVAYRGFFYLTGRVFTSQLDRLHGASWLAAGWVCAGFATLAFWGLAALPWDIWAGLAIRFRGRLIASLALGLFATWATRALASVLWSEQLGALTLVAVQSLLRLLVSDLIVDSTARLVGNSNFEVRIGSDCSGFEGIGLIWIFLAVYLGFWRRSLRFPQVLVLIPVATLLIWLLNAVRIAALVCLGCWGSPEVALGGFHSQAGWLAFNAVAFGIVWASQYVPWFRRDRELAAIGAEVAVANPATPFLAPFLALVLATMVTTALTPSGGFDGLYPIRVLAVAVALWNCRRLPTGLRWTCSWTAVGIGVLVFILWMALEPLTTPPAGVDVSSGLRGLPPALALAWLAFRTLGSVVTVPLAEELAFRGFLIRRLIAADFLAISPRRLTVLSFVVSSFLFGALHGRWLAGTLAGMLYALALYRRGELTDAVVAHAITNALIAATVVATGSWALWS